MVCRMWGAGFRVQGAGFVVEGCGLRHTAREEEGRLHRENRHRMQAANRRGMVAVSPSRSGVFGFVICVAGCLWFRV